MLDSRLEGLFRESFIRFFKDNSNAISEEQLSEYFNSPEFRKLNQQCSGLGYSYAGLVIHKLLHAHKICYREGVYISGSRRGIDSFLDENLTFEERKELVRILEDGIEIYPNAGDMQICGGS